MIFYHAIEVCLLLVTKVNSSIAHSALTVYRHTVNHMMPLDHTITSACHSLNGAQGLPHQYDHVAEAYILMKYITTVR